MPIVHSSGKTMNKDYTITIQSTITFTTFFRDEEMLSLPSSETTPSRSKFALRAGRRKGAQATRRHFFSF